MPKIGISLGRDMFLSDDHVRFRSHAMTRSELLLRLKWEAGIDTIEFRGVHPDTDPHAVLMAANIAWDSGLEISIHSVVADMERVRADVFDPLAELFPRMRQERVTVVIHPLVRDVIPYMSDLIAYADAQNLPVRLALENKTDAPEGLECECAQFVSDAVTRLASPRVGTCYDIGHWFRYFLEHPDLTRPDTEPEPFLRQVVHAHIYSVCALQHTDRHHGLEAEEPELEGAIRRMLRYLPDDAICNLEIDYSDYKHFDSRRDTAIESLYPSIERLRAMIRSAD